MSMQQNIFEPSSLPPLPEPGFFELWVLEQPLLPAIALGVLGILVIITLNATPTLARIRFPLATIAVLASVGVYAIGSAVVTQREVLRQRAAELVRTVAQQDGTALRAMLDDHAVLRSAFGSARNADQIVQLAASRRPDVITSAQTGRVRVGMFGPQVATTQIRVRTKGSALPTLSWWRVDWQRPDQDRPDWRVTHIEPIWVQGIPNPGGRD